jgi:type II secretory pathway pseudopilin PulG
MVVLAVIGILMMGMFRLMEVVKSSNEKVTTEARIQRIKNALSGYYAIHGCYPPVKNMYAPLDPEDPSISDYAEISTDLSDDGRFTFAARAQPLGFGYPNKKSEARSLNQLMVHSKKSAFAVSESTPDKVEKTWKACKLFKFGMLSFLLPRIELMNVRDNGGRGDVEWDWGVPLDFYLTAQWRDSNSGVPVDGSRDETIIAYLETQMSAENDVCARWLPNFEKMLACASTNNVLGVQLKNEWESSETMDKAGQFKTFKLYKGTAGQVVLMEITCYDSWGVELFYYSEPPYQSYRLWSAGPNKKTFPPWLDPKKYNEAKCREWTADDIVAFDR